MTATDGAAALQCFHAMRPVVVLLDFELPDVPATALLHQFRNNGNLVPVVVLARKPEVAAAVRATRAGATDFLDRATSPEDLERAVRAILSSMPETAHAPIHADLAAVLADYPRFFRRSERMQAVERLVLDVAPMEAPVIILGEPGVGKEALARILHRLSLRSGGPLVGINCTGLPEAVLDSELFGEQGAAGRDRRAGRLEQARNGSVVIAEISEMSARMQAKTLHLLRDREYSLVGGSDLQAAAARVIATTHRNLNELAGSGEFRPDLHEAFAWRITVPPLRDRREEIPGLVRDYLDRFARELGREPCGLSRPTLELLLEYDWPGNVRELANVLKRRVALDDENHLREEVHARIRVARARPPRPGYGASVLQAGKTGPDAGLRAIARHAAEEAELAAIRQVLESLNWNRAAAARRLKISYKTLLNKLNRGGLEPPKGTRRPRARK